MLIPGLSHSFFAGAAFGVRGVPGRHCNNLYFFKRTITFADGHEKEISFQPNKNTPVLR
jgi:hypothetical protein